MTQQQQSQLRTRCLTLHAHSTGCAHARACAASHQTFHHYSVRCDSKVHHSIAHTVSLNSGQALHVQFYMRATATASSWPHDGQQDMQDRRMTDSSKATQGAKDQTAGQTNRQPSCWDEMTKRAWAAGFTLISTETATVHTHDVGDTPPTNFYKNMYMCWVLTHGCMPGKGQAQRCSPVFRVMAEAPVCICPIGWG